MYSQTFYEHDTSAKSCMIPCRRLSKSVLVHTIKCSWDVTGRTINIILVPGMITR